MEDSAPPFLGVEHSLSGKRWRSRLTDERLAAAIAQKLSVPEIIGRVLAARDVGLDECGRYLDPTLKDLMPDPSCLMEMDQACDRLARCITDGKTVGVFGDYDVDGATSAAVLHRFVSMAGGTCHSYIPDRIKEGYGPNLPALEKLHGDGADVIVTVDCGITAFDVIDAATERGIDIIVIDHHLAEVRLPKAVAVVNPNRLDDESGLGQLAAVGVTFMLIVGVNRHLRQAGWYQTRPEPKLQSLLDLVALGTVCDVVPLKGLNRALVTQGLKIMAKRLNPGLVALSDVAGIHEPPAAFHLGYILGPRVNAGGRVGQPDLGARLLSSDDPDLVRPIAQRLDDYNLERRAIEAAVLEEASLQVETTATGEPNAPTIAVGQDWHPGVIGIVASRLKDRFGKPAIVISLSDGIGKGSGRSIPGVDLGAAVTAARQAGHLINGGGHKMAAGLTVDEASVPVLQAFLSERLSDAIAASTRGASLGLDGSVTAAGANLDFVGTLQKAGPYGAGNPEPRFVIPNAQIVKADIVGENHVRCIITDSTRARLNTIAFRSADTEMGRNLLNHGGLTFHLAGHLRTNFWRGEASVQLTVDDAAKA